MADLPDGQSDTLIQTELEKDKAYAVQHLTAYFRDNPDAVPDRPLNAGYTPQGLAEIYVEERIATHDAAAPEGQKFADYALKEDGQRILELLGLENVEGKNIPKPEYVAAAMNAWKTQQQAPREGPVATEQLADTAAPARASEPTPADEPAAPKIEDFATRVQDLKIDLTLNLKDHLEQVPEYVRARVGTLAEDEIARTLIDMKIAENEAGFIEAFQKENADDALLELLDARRDGDGFIISQEAITAAANKWMADGGEARPILASHTAQATPAEEPAVEEPAPGPADGETAREPEPAVRAEGNGPASELDNGDLPDLEEPQRDPSEPEPDSEELPNPIEELLRGRDSGTANTELEGDGSPVTAPQAGHTTWFGKVTPEMLTALFSGKLSLSALDRDTLILLATMVPGILKEPAIMKALGIEAERAGLTLEEFQEKLGNGEEIVLKDVAGNPLNISADDRVLQIIKENSTLFGIPGQPRTGVQAFEFTDKVKGLGKFDHPVLVLHGTNGNLLVDDGKSLRTVLANAYEHEVDGRKVAVPDAPYDATDAILKMNWYLNKRIAPNADGSPQEINMRHYTSGWKNTQTARDMDFIAALDRANHNNQKLNIHADAGIFARKKLPLTEDGTIDFSRYKFDESAILKMQASGINAAAVLQKYKERMMGEARTEIVDIDSNLTAARLTPETAELPQGVPTARRGRANAADARRNLEAASNVGGGTERRPLARNPEPHATRPAETRPAPRATGTDGPTRSMP